MELGLCWDDELFEKKETKNPRPKQQPYNVKVCEKECMFTCPTPGDEVQRQNITKFQADFWYKAGKYDRAVEAYTCIHDNPKVSSTTLERDIDESIIRCHLKLGNFDVALDFISDLIKKQGEDTSLLLVLAKICAAAGNSQGQISCFKSCISIHSYNHNFWYSLAMAYSNAFESIENSKQIGGNPTMKHLNDHIDTVLHSSTTKSQKDCLKLCINCNHCKCTQEMMLVDSAFICRHDQEETCCCQHTRNCSPEVIHHLNHLTEKLTIDQKHETPSTCAVEPKVCFGTRDGLQSTMNSEESLDNKRCNFNMTVLKHHKVCHSMEMTKKEKHYGLTLFAFFCFLRTRFLLQRAIWTSSSFVKEKLIQTMSEVEEQINSCVLCQCGELKKCILKQIESENGSLAGQQIDELDMHALYQGGRQKHWT